MQKLAKNYNALKKKEKFCFDSFFAMLVTKLSQFCYQAIKRFWSQNINTISKNTSKIIILQIIILIMKSLFRFEIFNLEFYFVQMPQN